MDDCMKPAIEPACDATPDQIEQQRRRGRDKKRRPRAAMTEEQRQAVHARDVSEESREADRLANAERKQHAWASLSEQERAAKRKSNAARKQHAWGSLSEEKRAAKRKRDAARKQQAHRSRRFIGVDCEGAGENPSGQQNLVLLNAEGEGSPHRCTRELGAPSTFRAKRHSSGFCRCPARTKRSSSDIFSDMTLRRCFATSEPKPSKISLSPIITAAAERATGRTTIKITQ